MQVCANELAHYPRPTTHLPKIFKVEWPLFKFFYEPKRCWRPAGVLIRKFTVPSEFSTSI